MALEIVALLVLLIAIAFVMNVVPVLGPPLWTVVALFVVQWEVPLYVATVTSTFAAAWGRVVLALVARRMGRALVRAQQSDVDEIAAMLGRQRRRLLPATFVYSIALPTSWLFMAAGIIGASMRPIFLGYWASRALVDTVLVMGAATASEALVRDAALGPTALAMQAFGILTFLLFLRLPWVRWLARWVERREATP